MPLLNTFDFDVFLSYGWAGTADPDRGARGWACQLRDLLRDRLAVNIESPRIYFDADAPRVGPFPDDIYRALDRSAVLVFLVSPGSYRVNSWCQREIAYFWDRARPLAKSTEVLAPEDRILKVIQSPVPIAREDEPIPLRDLRTFDLFERIEAGIDEIPQAADLLQPKSERVRKELDALSGTLQLRLERVKELEQTDNYHFTRKRVFLGPTFSELDHQRLRALRRELLLDGNEVRSVTPLPALAETEGDHRWRVDRALENVNLAVHLVPHVVPTSNWVRNPAAQQIRHCLLKSKQDNAFSVFLWEDPDQSESDFDSQCLQQIKEILPTQGDQNVKGMIFADLKVNIKGVLRKPPPPPPPPGPLDRFDVVIQHNDVDSPDAARIRNHLKTRHNLRAQFANPTLPKSSILRNIKRNKEQFYQRARRFVVLYGQTDDDWTNEVCFAMLPHITLRSGGLVLVAPPPHPPEGKKFYLAPDDDRFDTRRCFDGQYEAAIDEWLLNVLPAALQEGAGQ